MHIQEVFDLVKDDICSVEEVFKKNLKSSAPLVGKVGEYILASGGKRFRPLLLLLSARLCGYKGENHVPLAGVMEFIHTATLLHDDVVDNANMRRGNAAANTVWGDGASILVGDFLLSKAFTMAVSHGNERVLQVLSQSTTRMAEGEMLQLVKHGDIDMTEENYFEIISNKTAVLFSSCSQVAAILGEAGLEREVALANYGMRIGTAYQLMDDCLDYVSTDKDLGKSIGTDLREGKVTLPLIQAYKVANETERSVLKTAIDADEFDDTKLKEVLDIIKRCGGIEYAEEYARRLVAEAKADLECFEPVVERAALEAVADYVIERSF
jgi:octaprenyl-diphosphate synthase